MKYVVEIRQHLKEEGYPLLVAWLGEPGEANYALVPAHAAAKRFGTIDAAMEMAGMLATEEDGIICIKIEMVLQ